MRAISFATDLSAGSALGFEPALALSNESGVPSHLLHVVHGDLPSHISDLLAQAARNVNAKRRTVEGEGAGVVMRIESGTTCEKLLQKADDLEAAPIAIGTQRTTAS